MESKKSSSVGAVVLAAGMSARMGRAKQLLRLGETSILDRALRNVQIDRLAETVLILGFAAQAIREQLPNSLLQGLKIVVNEEYRQGMSSSLRAGLAALDPGIGAALIVLADQPFVRPETLDRIIDRYRESGAQIVIPIFQGLRGNPVLLDRDVFPAVMALTGDVGFRSVFTSRSEGIVKVEVDDIGILLDIDSKEDFDRLERFSRSAEDQAEWIDRLRKAGKE